MSDQIGDDRQFSRTGSLRDGTPVTIRVMRPDDRERIVAAFNKLDRSTVYTRFFSLRNEVPASALERIAAIDFVNLAGLVVTRTSDSDEIVIGSASYVRVAAPDGAKAAEVAFTIEEDYQGQGLASQLLASMIDLARRHGITRFVAEVLAGNKAMLTVFERSGLPMRKRSEHEVIHVTLELTPQAA